MKAELPPAIATDGTLLDKLALSRQKLWEAIGAPISPNYMTEAVMDRDFRGRFSCINKDVLDEAQRALKFIACPKCVIEKSYGEISVTRLWIGVQDDVMTVFKAMARCFCYNCAHEEYWPLSHDPRKRDDEREAYMKECEYAMKMQQAQIRNQQAMQNRPPGIGDSLLGGLGNQGLGALGSILPDEMQALQNVYRGLDKAGIPKNEIEKIIKRRMGF